MINARELKTFVVTCTECGTQATVGPTTHWARPYGTPSLMEDSLPVGWIYDRGTRMFRPGRSGFTEINPLYKEPATLCDVCKNG